MTLSPAPPSQYERSPGAIAAFISQAHGKVMSFEGAERRAHQRYVVAMPSIAQPLDDSFQPDGPPFHAATRDISVGGIALIHTRPVAVNYLGVRLTLTADLEIQLLVEVLRCSKLECYFDIAGRFVVEM